MSNYAPARSDGSDVWASPASARRVAMSARTTAVIVAGVVAGVVALGLAVWLLSSTARNNAAESSEPPLPTPTADSVEAPDLVGLSLAEAATAVEGVFEGGVRAVDAASEEWDFAVGDAWTVCAQSPGVGDRAREDSDLVVLVVATGGECPAGYPDPIETADSLAGEMTAGQRAAVTAALAYLDDPEFTPSRPEFIHQLVEYNGMSTADAVYAIDFADIDWVDSATRYVTRTLELLNPPRSELLRDLVNEGFTFEDSVAAVDAADVDFFALAARRGEAYVDLRDFDRADLVPQLVVDGFTPAQARYAADANGL